MMKVKIGILLDTFVILFYFLVIVPNFNINPIVSITLLFGYIAITPSSDSNIINTENMQEEYIEDIE